MQKLILGTAQFGSDYGIKHDGVPSEQELERIARAAWDGGIRIIHTSWQYNLPKICEAIFSEFDTLEKGVKYPEELYWYDQNRELHGDGLSVYTLDDLKGLDDYDYDILQIPVNVLDNRFLQIARERNADGLKEIHARSVFLQGLLLMDTKDLPLWVNGDAFKQIYRFHETCRRINVEPYEAALGYVLGLPEIDHIIIGVNFAKQLEQLLVVKPMIWEYDFSIQDENILDPRRWPHVA